LLRLLVNKRPAGRFSKDNLKPGANLLSELHYTGKPEMAKIDSCLFPASVPR
jgi:hypothetical protein